MRIETARKRRQPIPDGTPEEPLLKPHLVFWWNAYCDLIPTGLSWIECKAYAEHYDIPFETFRYVLRSMNS